MHELEPWMPSRVSGIVPLWRELFHRYLRRGGENGATRVRIREASETGARIVAAACPSCAKMLADAVKTEEKEGRLEVLGVAEIIGRARAK